jgi:hypothetical protein
MKSNRPRLLSLLLLVATALLSGCATAVPTYKLHSTAATRAPALQQVAIAPVDGELAELTAGGMLEPREEWTAAAVKNITDALAAETGYKPALSLPGAATMEVRTELEDVQALLRAITLNRMSQVVPGRGIPFPAATEAALTYNTGPLPEHVKNLQSDAVLFVFIRDSFASAGRKGLLALSFVGAALTGVAVVPAMGSTAMSAALVDRDGTVLWFNHSLGGHDPRTPEGARTLVKDLLKGLPRQA